MADTARGSSSSAAVPVPVDADRGKKREADSMDVMVVAMDDARLIHENIVYSLLQSIEELSAINTTGYDDAEVAVAKCDGLEMLDTFDVYDVVENKDRDPEGNHVDTKWEAAMRAEKSKLRILGREFKFLEERDDCFAPGPTNATSKVIDALSVKDDDDEDDPIVSFVADFVSALNQAPEDELFYAKG